MQKALIPGVIAAFALMVASCAYHNEEELYPDALAGCDTSKVTYSGTVMPILRANCLDCHGTSGYEFSGGGVNLEDFNSFKARIEEGAVMGAVTHSRGYSPMPKSGGKLDTCSIKKVQIWIDNGMKQD
jgi:mono/diheme cytochrome c family protein